MTLATLAPPDSGTRTRAKTPRTLLVNPSAGGAFRTLSLQMPPLGILCVASYVEKLGFPVDVVDRCVAGWREPLRLDGYDVVGIHADTTRYYRALEIAAQAKAAGAIVVMGGPHPCYVEEEVLGTGVVDYIVRGEGEVIFGNLLQALRDGSPVSKVRGITYRENGRIVRTPPEWAITDLDTLPMPAREKVPMDRYLRTRLGGRPITNVHTSRGCPFKCSFCSSSWFDGVKWRTRSPESIGEEVEQLVTRYGFRAIAFMDDLFTMDSRRVIAVCEELLRRDLDIHWWCFTRADTLVKNEEMVRLMARSGCRQVFIGVESASEEVLKDYNKKSTTEMPPLAVEMCRKYGIESLCSYILGDIRETRRDVLRTIKYAKLLDSDVAQFTILCPFPGTALWEQVQDRIVDRNWSHYDAQHTVMALPHLSRGELQWLLVRANIEFYFRSRKSVYGFFRFLRNRRFGWDALSELFRMRYCT